MSVVLDERLKAIPQKEKKFARTRLALLKALLDELREKSFDEIKIRDLCIRAEISEPTFYNYFPEKNHLLLYFIQIWSLEVSVYASRKKMDGSGYELLRSLFQYTAKKSRKNPRVIAEVIAFQAKTPPPKSIPPLTLAERYLYFPGAENIESIPATGLDGLLERAIGTAIERGELAPDTNVQSLFMAIAALFFGIPIVARSAKKASHRLWEGALALLWRGAGGEV
jgi:AcrR family transcriptional regulator